jgi:heavy metal sensor kinase
VKRVSLRLKIAAFASVLVVAVVIVFAAFSAWWFYHEQIDMVSGDETRTPTAQQISDAREETSELIGAYLAALPLVAILSALGAWWMAARVTRPLVRLDAAASQIDAQSLDSRLPDPGTRDEISTLAGTLNHLLDRLERSFRQSTRFSADASHELRTPLAVMRTQLEHAIKDHPSGEQTPVLIELLEENHRLSSVADKLLLLARADAGQLLPGRVKINLSKLIAEVADDYDIMARDRHMHVSGRVVPDIWTDGDEGLLRQLARNLFDNALKHNIPEGSIAYELTSDSETARFSIANSGPSIPEEARSSLFDRFFRLDESRDRNEGGAGLGLSLCREIAHAHGGTIVLADAQAQNEFILKLPSVTR